MKKLKPVTVWVVTYHGRLTTLVCQTRNEAIQHAGKGEEVVKVLVTPISKPRKVNGTKYPILD